MSSCDGMVGFLPDRDLKNYSFAAGFELWPVLPLAGPVEHLQSPQIA